MLLPPPPMRGRLGLPPLHRCRSQTSEGLFLLGVKGCGKAGSELGQGAGLLLHTGSGCGPTVTSTLCASVSSTSLRSDTAALEGSVKDEGGENPASVPQKRLGNEP